MQGFYSEQINNTNKKQASTKGKRGVCEGLHHREMQQGHKAGIAYTVA